MGLLRFSKRIGGRETFLLHLAEGFEGAVEGSVVGGGIAVAEFEAVVVELRAFFEDVVFAVADAAETPVVFAHFVEQDALGCGGRVVFAEEGVEEELVVGWIFVREEEDARAEAVASGILGGSGFAFGAAGSGLAVGAGWRGMIGLLGL